MASTGYTLHYDLKRFVQLKPPVLRAIIGSAAQLSAREANEMLALITPQSAQFGAAELGAICKSNSKTSNDDEREIIRDGGPLGC